MGCQACRCVWVCGVKLQPGVTGVRWGRRSLGWLVSGRGVKSPSTGGGGGGSGGAGVPARSVVAVALTGLVDEGPGVLLGPAQRALAGPVLPLQRLLAEPVLLHQLLGPLHPPHLPDLLQDGSLHREGPAVVRHVPLQPGLRHLPAEKGAISSHWHLALAHPSKKATGISNPLPITPCPQDGPGPLSPQQPAEGWGGSSTGEL